MSASRRASAALKRTFASFDTAYSGSPVIERVRTRSFSHGGMPVVSACALLATVTMRAGADCLMRSRSSVVRRKCPT